MDYEPFEIEMIPDLKELPSSDRETIIQKLNIAIADDEPKMLIHLNYYKSGIDILVYKSEYMDLYNAFKRV